ncbi:hypothetical protein [Halomonas sp. M4R1S46]|uniref:hypothetical protein n=1 Tax=Halomonas sp. M4R1S46 TaxID=2982692 RepID=UPI0021E3BE8E|nr:hypothetical protein [Halomonas sp. M4R1S46]UYG09062.1 hypothetical protein OCT48_06955 [Halomonas sp. M4R1S46]
MKAKLVKVFSAERFGGNGRMIFSEAHDWGPVTGPRKIPRWLQRRLTRRGAMLRLHPRRADARRVDHPRTSQSRSGRVT